MKPMLPQQVEKPDGARRVVTYDFRTIRDFRPIYVVGHDGPHHYDAENVTVRIVVEFDNDAAACEFEAKVRAMMPEVG